MSEYRRNRSRIEAQLQGVPQSEIEKTMAWQMANVNDLWFEGFVRPLLRLNKAFRRVMAKP